MLDKEGDGLLVTPPLAVGKKWVKPGADEFAVILNQFWLSIYRASNMVRRGELWRARMITDGPLRQQLLRILEWHAKAGNGEACDTWYDGRFLDEWVEPQVLALLPGIFAPFDEAGTRRAILAFMTLMDKLGRQTAEKWSYPYPIENQTHILDWIKVLLLAE